MRTVIVWTLKIRPSAVLETTTVSEFNTMWNHTINRSRREGIRVATEIMQERERRERQARFSVTVGDVTGPITGGRLFVNESLNFGVDVQNVQVFLRGGVRGVAGITLPHSRFRFHFHCCWSWSLDKS